MYKIKKGDNTTKPTHTRIGDRKEIYGGSYNIPKNKKSEFYKLYYDHVFVKNNKEYYTEKQYGNCIAVDIDLRHCYEDRKGQNYRRYNKKHIEELIVLYLDTIKDFYIIEPNVSIPIMVFEKENIHIPEDKFCVRDGIHLIIGLQADFETQLLIRKEMIAHVSFNDDFNSLLTINGWENVFDEAISKGTNNWQLIGSRKPEYEEYRLTYMFENTIDPDDNEFMTELIFEKSEQTPTYITEENIEKFSVQYDKHPKLQLKKPHPKKTTSSKQSGNKNSEEAKTQSNENNSNEYYNIIDKFIENDLLRNTCDAHESWVLIGTHLKVLFEEDITLFQKLTEKYGSDNKKEEYEKWWNEYIKPKYDDKSKALNIIKKIAKETDEDKYKKVLKQIKIQNALEENKNITIVKNDTEARDIIYEKIKDIVKYSNGTFYIKKEHIWIKEVQYIEDWLFKNITESDIWKLNQFGLVQSYVQDYCHAKHIYELLTKELRLKKDDTFVDKLHTTTTGKICFIDGVLDFVNKKFYKWEDITFEYYSCIQIPLQFAEYYLSPNMEIINIIRNDILMPLFDKDIDRALHFFSRAMSGFTGDKNYGTYLGNRNCGKGILYALFESFYEYLKPFELSNVLVSRNDNKTQETSRMLYWLFEFEFSRLAFAQETPQPEENLKINGRLFKKINSGGDTIVARRNYDRKDTNFIIDTTMFIAGNNELKYSEEDVKEQEISFVGVKQFKTQEEINKMKEDKVDERVWKSFRVKDPNLKNKVKTEEFKLAFIYLIYSSFKNQAVPVKIVKNDDNDEESNQSLQQRILNDYIITSNKSDYILCTEINIKGFDKSKVTKSLEEMGVDKKKLTKGEDRNKWVYIGIKKKTKDDKDNEVDSELEDEDD